MNRSQEKAIETFKRHLNEDNARISNNTVTTEFTVEPTEYGVLWIKARQEANESVPANSLLRLLQRTTWMVQVGRRGALTIHMGPKSLAQFAGKSWLGFNIKADYTGSNL